MAKFSNYSIGKISKPQAKFLLDRWHYLTDQSQGFRFSDFCYGAFIGDTVVAACLFTGFPVAELFKGIWGIDNFRSVNQRGFFELSRLVIDPNHQHKHFASWFVAKCIKQLKKDCLTSGSSLRAIISYADDDHHAGTIYAATNFNYYGLTDKKYNVWVPCDPLHGGKPLPPHKRPGRNEVHWKQCTRGWREHLNNDGILIERGRKHRFLMVFDKSLPPVLWERVKWENNKAGQCINTHPKTKAAQSELF